MKKKSYKRFQVAVIRLQEKHSRLARVFFVLADFFDAALMARKF